MILHHSQFQFRTFVIVVLTVLPGASGSFADDGQLPVLAGRVVNEAGDAIPDAIIAGRVTFPGSIRILDRSGEDGAFRVELEEGADPDSVWLFARADGYGLADALYNERFNAARQPDDDLPELTLPRAVLIRGRLVDAAGNPARGVRVRPYRVLEFGNGRRRTLPEVAAQAEDFWQLNRWGSDLMNVARSSEVILPWTETDDDGAFEIDLIGADCVAGLFATGMHTAAETILVRTDDGDEFTVGTSASEPDLTVHSRLDFNHVIAPSVPIAGNVTQAGTGIPVVGATVNTWRVPGIHFQKAEQLTAVRTNGAGEYRLLGMPLGRNRIFALPPEGVAMVAVERFPEFSLDEPFVETDFSMPTGVTLTGTVTDKQTGEPVPGRVSAYVFSDNPHLEPLEPSSPSGDNHSAPVDEQGRYTIQVLPGPGILGFRAENGNLYRRGGGWDEITHHRFQEDGDHTLFRTEPVYVQAYNYHKLVEIDTPADVATHTVDILLGEERVDVPLEIRGPRNLTQVYYSNQNSDRGPFSLLQPRVERGVIRFFPGETTRVTQAHSHDHKYAGWTFVERTDESAAIEIVEASTVGGRVLQADGTPLAGARLKTPYDYDPSTKTAQLPSQPESGYYPRTDDDGRFEFVGLPADLPLTVEIDIYDAERNLVIDRRYLFEDLTLEVGEDRDLGELQFHELPRPEAE
jgi:hypothetical protein